MSPYVQEKSFRKSQPGPIHCHTLSFIHSWPPPWIICHRLFSPPLKSLAPFRVTDVGFIKALIWRIAPCRHQLIIQGVDLGTTPFSTLKLACLNGKFLTSGDRYTSMTFDQKILCGVRCQVLYSHHVNCTVVPWGSLSLSVIPLALVNGLHY